MSRSQNPGCTIQRRAGINSTGRRRRAARSVAGAVAATGLIWLLAGCGGASSAVGTGGGRTHVVTDMGADKVRVPDHVTRIAEQFPAHTATDIMLGVGKDLVAIPQNVSTIPFLKAVDPSITKVPQLFPSDGDVNMEQLLKQNPDVVSSTGSGAENKPFQNAGLPAVDMTFTTFSGLIRSIRLAESVYGGVAKTRGAAYIAYLDSKIKLIKSTLAKAHLPASQLPSVVHVASYPPLVIDGGKSIIQQWIQLAGGKDLAANLSGTHITASVEQLLKWNPDVLIVETPGGDQGLMANSGQSVITALSKAPGWKQLKAVKDGQVYLNPQGLYPWDRFGPEEALQIQWAAKVLHPKLFANLDIRAITRNFYKKFFNYTPTNAQLNAILQTTSASGIASAVSKS